MLHLLYILAFTIIAFIAINNLIRSLITISTESARGYSTARTSPGQKVSTRGIGSDSMGVAPHPELLDSNGRPISEPLLVMRSVSVEDAREQLDAIYNASPSQSQETEEES